MMHLSGSALPSAEGITRYAGSATSLQYIQDYSHVVKALTWQRQGILLAVAVLTGSFFSPLYAALFFLACMLCEGIDLRLSKEAIGIAAGDTRATKLIFFKYLANTIASTLLVSGYAVWVGLTENGIGLFTAMFCLFAAALHAAINNHQFAAALVVRLIFYGLSFIVLSVHDLWMYRPPLHSEAWLQFFTVLFVMYFLIDCSLHFLRMYRRDIKRLKELEAEHKKVKAALVLKSEFVAIVSHELRTPLTSIKGSLDLVNSGKFGELPTRIQNLLGLAGKNAQRLANLVNDLLDIQKLEDGQMRFKTGVVEIGRFLTEAISAHQGLAEQCNVRFVNDAQSQTPVHVNTDPARMMQVMGHVLSNAAKFSPDQGDVHIGYGLKADKVCIFVRDQGIGIPPDVEDQIFARFVQLDSSNQRQFGGTGLGMNIARDITKAIGGKISYTSVLNVGTTFFIELPCAFASAPD